MIEIEIKPPKILPRDERVFAALRQFVTEHGQTDWYDPPEMDAPEWLKTFRVSEGKRPADQLLLTIRTEDDEFLTVVVHSICVSGPIKDRQPQPATDLDFVVTTLDEGEHPDAREQFIPDAQCLDARLVAADYLWRLLAFCRNSINFYDVRHSTG